VNREEFCPTLGNKFFLRCSKHVKAQYAGLAPGYPGDWLPNATILSFCTEKLSATDCFCRLEKLEEIVQETSFVSLREPVDALSVMC